MKPMLSLVLTLGLAAPVLAQAPTDSEDPSSLDTTEALQEPSASQGAAPAPFEVRRLEFGLSGVETDTLSSRFREYQAVPTGVVVPNLRFAGNQKFWYDVLGENVLQRDARYRAVAEPGGIGLEAEFVKIPHSFGNAGHTLLQQTEAGVFTMSDSLQQAFQDAIKKQYDSSRPGVNYAFLSKLVAPSLADAPAVDMALLRERGQAEIRLARDKPWDVRLTYFQEKRRGTRPGGTSFGFGNVVETPEAIDYRTRDFGISGEWRRSSLLLRGSFHYNDFDNHNPTQTFDNPFRIVDSTDASAYSAPGSGSIAGAATGRIALPPTNSAVTGSLGFLVKFRSNSRFSTDATVGEWRQDAAFMPETTNSAIAVPDQGLPASLDGRIKTFTLSSALTSQPARGLHLAARFRRYDMTNDTPRISLHEGYVRFDAVFEDIPRISVPYGNTTEALSLSASYDIGSVTVEGGYKLDRWDRTFRETERTNQNVGYLKADVRALDWLVLRATAEKGSRSFDGLDLERSEHASYLEPESPVNLLAIPPETRQIDGTPLCPTGTTCNLRYDQAEKDIQRLGGLLILSPGGKATITLSYLNGKDDYEKSLFGLTSFESESITAEVDYTPTDRMNVYAFYTRENLSAFLRGRQSGATVSGNPLDTWIADMNDEVDSFGGGATLGLVKEKMELKLYGNYQKVDGNNDISSPPGGAPANARAAVGGVAGIPMFDDTKLSTVSADLAYRATKQLVVGLGGWYQKYTLRDSGTSGLPNYAPGSFFLAADDSDFTAKVVYVRATYAW